MNREDIKRKIKALLSKTVKNGATDDEAETAIRITNDLMKKYNLSYEDTYYNRRKQ